MSNLGVVIAVRNERDSLPRVLAALDSQSSPPSVVVVVDDGSTDGTGEFLSNSSKDFSFRMEKVALPFHSRSYVGRPELAEVFNAGLRRLSASTPPPDFVMVLGGDHVLPRDYVARVLAEMDRDRSLAVASGWIADEPYWEHAPRGSSMVARRAFWEAAGGLRFPVNYGWESWLYLKALQMGLRTRSLKDLPTRVSRKTSITKGVLYGRAMYALGYDPVYAMGRCLILARRSPRGAVQMLAGFLSRAGVSRLDVSGYVGQSQRRALLGRALHVATRMGRR